MRSFYKPGYWAVLLILFFFSCSGTKKVTSKEDNAFDFREELLDTLYVTGEEFEVKDTGRIYRPSAKRSYDILHTRLEVRFDWEKQHVLGIATLSLTPFFYPINEVQLDAVNFDIHMVRLQEKDTDLKYDYDGEKLTIKLPGEYKKGDKLNIRIDYTAKPEESVDHEGEAITSDKGLFFINPLGKEKNKPKQIWTQGETENNKKWFPTFDKPNERCSQEIFITVEDNLKTLSNGKLVSSQKHDDGTRTDHWQQVLPHAPYLFMLAVGEFYEEVEYWNKVPVHYFVEKGFQKSARKIFNHTPEMMTFFSEKLDYSFPWDKYAQIVVRDFVSGAMENTSAVVFGEFVQKTERELIDNENDYIVAHELMHHWFGNLVTPEEWSNLTLNEGFANYAEYLWMEYKYGREKADYHRLSEMNGYFSQVNAQGAHPLIDYYYRDKEDMFDAHSYNKGGLVLHMLRKYVGDAAFFAALSLYLETNAFTSVEVDELRIAFEDITGEDLHWFFDQWFLKAGHPVMDVEYVYSMENKNMTIKIRQVQDSLLFPSCFYLPLNITTYHDGGAVKNHSFFMDLRVQDFVIPDLDKKPLAVVMDGDNTLLGLINETKSEEEYVNQFLNSSLVGDKLIALSSIQNKDAILDKLLSDKFFLFRSIGLESIPESLFPSYANKVQEMALFDPHSDVRGSALQALLAFSEEEVTTVLKRIVEGEQAYPVLSLALEGLSFYDQESAEKYAKGLKNDSSPYMINSVLGVFANSENEEYLPFFHDQLSKITIYQIFEFFEKYHAYLENINLEGWKNSSSYMYSIATDKNEDVFFKFFSMNSLLKLVEIAKNKEGENYEIFVRETNEKIEKVKEMETDPFLLERYSEINTN